MARNRWTLALILICLPILATVITAFRIRDLPKSHDSSKLDTKKTQQCENCDVKIAEKVHSVKIESDSHINDDLKKSVREKPQTYNEKASVSKSIHKYVVKSEEDDDESEEFKLPNVQTGFKKEPPRESKLSKSEKDEIINNRKPDFSLHKKENKFRDDNDDDDHKYGAGKSKTVLKPKVTEITKEQPAKLKVDKNIPLAKTIAKIPVRHEDEKENDVNGKNKIKLTEKFKLSDTKEIPVKPKLDSKHISKIEVNDSDNNDNDDDEDDDDEDEDDEDDDDDVDDDNENADNDDDEDDDDEDDYEGLDYVDELFKILNISPGTKTKKPIDKEQRVKSNAQVKSKISDNIKKVESVYSDKIKESDDGDEDDDDKDHIDKSNEIGLKKTQTKILQSVSKSQDTQSQLIKKPSVIINKNAIKSDKLMSQPVTKDIKNEEEEIHKKTDGKVAVHKEEIETKPNVSVENKKMEMKRREEKSVDKTKTLDDSRQKIDEEKAGIKVQASTATKKEEKKETKDSKVADAKPKTDFVKKNKKPETEIVKSKSHEKGDINSSNEKSDKKTTHLSKKDQTEHKDIFKAPEQKKDIKYDFEKPNAYKDSHKSFDYSEFEKMQVLKSHHKEKRKEKTSGENIDDSREERYLKHVTDALNRRNLLKSEFEDFYAFFPTFAPNFSRIHNPECRRHGQILLRQLRGMKLWALNMLDATAKIPSGVLQGNGIQLGDFDQCLGSRARVQLDTGSVVKVQGKYCLARIDVKAEHTELEAPVYLAQAKSLIRSRIDDPGHFVPRFSTLSWGVCVPSACDREDVEVIIKDAVKHYQHKSGVIIKVKVDEDDCHTDEGSEWERWLELPTVLTLSFYGVIILLVLVATIQDFIARRQSEESPEETNEQAECDQKDKENEENKEPKKQSANFLSPFSLYHSISKLVASGDTDEISCIHGIRGIATVALLVAHKFMPVASMPYTNRLKITETASSPLWTWCRAGWVYTDCFLLLSGTLTSHRITSDSDTGAVRRIFSRYLRLTPALIAVVLFYAYIWDKLSTGPMWGTFVTKNAEICERGWWWNLLYVQNHFGLEDMCAPQTHQLALDMQLTIFGGIIVWALQSEVPFAKLILPGLHLLSGYLRYTTVRDHRLTLLAYHGVSVSQLYRTARLSYTSVLHRCSPHLIGLSLGLALQKPSRHGKFLLALGWLTSVGLGALVVWSGIDSGSTQYRYSATFAAQYALIAPVASAMSIAWVIYAVQCGTCDFLSRALCWRPLVFISRLSYALFLCQFIIFITNIGTVRTSKEFTLMSLIDVQEISAILLASTILTVTFVIPMQSMHKIFAFEWKSETEKSPEKEIKDSESKAEEESKEADVKKESTPPTRSRHNLVAHREVLEEIPEVEVEYETQRETTEGLDEIIEEEEGIVGEEDDDINDLEIIEEEEAGEEEAWLEREGERSYSRGDNRNMDEWEWTANGSGRSGAQYYRYSR